MIKAQSTLIGVIAKPATMRQDKDGRSQVTFSVKITIPGSRNNMPGKEVFVSVNKYGTEAELAQYPEGARIEAIGTLTFKKSGDNLYLNFLADSIKFNPETEKNGIEGTLEFKGTIGNVIDEKKDKNGNDYVSFSAYSAEKIRDNFEYTWVRFVKFNYTRESFLKTKAKIHVKGKLSITAYQGRLCLDCMMDEVKEWERMPFAPANPKEELPF
jgi:hypothetical protein